MSRPGTDSALRDAMNRAVLEAERRKSDKDHCPEDQDGCGKKSALLTLSFRGITVMRLCRFCPWTSAQSGTEQKRTRQSLKVMKGGKGGT